jgi:hypothetical protein
MKETVFEYIEQKKLASAVSQGTSNSEKTLTKPNAG